MINFTFSCFVCLNKIYFNKLPLQKVIIEIHDVIKCFL